MQVLALTDLHPVRWSGEREPVETVRRDHAGKRRRASAVEHHGPGDGPPQPDPDVTGGPTGSSRAGADAGGVRSRRSVARGAERRLKRTRRRSRYTGCTRYPAVRHAWA
ncbi:hypothetical protein Acy02nite_47020 [Actinoplanes cyaneus]|uniref:Uncharacterized protein n=1 Tax=Actinoplanes cyaneus TaxID=52696 RepID=A0A919ILI5_9ACTN|nr:hypothetical protein Acy02nite_47020 [Actinoplanes cyaneus]